MYNLLVSTKKFNVLFDSLLRQVYMGFNCFSIVKELCYERGMLIFLIFEYSNYLVAKGHKALCNHINKWTLLRAQGATSGPVAT